MTYDYFYRQTPIKTINKITDVVNFLQNGERYTYKKVFVIKMFQTESPYIIISCEYAGIWANK